ncbi:hypothetical protein Ancab_001276 [Ancistrocladus abbreviatus]
MAEEEDSKRKRSVEYGGGDRFATESSMKDCFDDSETKPKLILKLKLSAPKVKRRRQFAFRTVCIGAELHQGCATCEDANIYHPIGGFRRGGRQCYVPY